MQLLANRLIRLREEEEVCARVYNVKLLRREKQWTTSLSR